MTEFVQQTINAISLGGTYALLALGLAIVFSILKMINFAHGTLMTIGAYAMYFVVADGLPFWVAVVVGLIASTLAAVLMERIAFRPLRGAGFVSLLLTSFAVNGILVVLFQDLISARSKTIATPAWLNSSIDFFGVSIAAVQLVTIVTVLVCLVVLTVFFRRTAAGLSMRAAATDFAVTRLMGVRANVVIAGAFALSGLLAGIAAVLWVANRGSVDPYLGEIPVIKAFIAATIGGLGSLSGAVAGGFFLGAVEVLLAVALPDSMQPYREALALSLVILVPLVRPNGLFVPAGAHATERA